MANLCMLWGFVRPLPCLLVLLAMGCNRSVVEPPPPEESGQAAWIVHPALVDVPRQNLWLAYRKTFTLAEAPRAARTRVAVDSKYWLWVNGKMVVREGGLKRGPTPTGTYADEVDLAAHLRAGENTIAVLVWHWGRDGLSHNDSGRPGLFLQAELDPPPSGPDTSLVSDASWRVRVHPAFGTAGPPLPNSEPPGGGNPLQRLPEWSIRFDARHALDGWTRPGYDDRDWLPASAVGRPPVRPWGELVARPIPPWKDYGVRRYTNHGSWPAVSTGDTIVVDLPYNAQVTPYFKIDAPAGLMVDIRTDNFVGGGVYTLRAEYITRAGEQEFEAWGWINGHQVRYAFPPGVRILDLAFRETGYDTEFAGRSTSEGGFTSDDPFFDRLWEKARRTLYVNMRDTYMDTPDRERAQWWGDVVNALGQMFYSLSPSSHQLARKAILELVNWQRPNGTLFSPVPSGDINLELPLQMLASVGHYGFWTYYLHTGDTETIRQVYPSVKRYMQLWRIGSDGLVVHRPGDWDWGDNYGDGNIDIPVLENAWYMLALRGQRDMARVAGHTADVPEIEAKMDAIQRAFHPAFWKGDSYRSDSAQVPDDRANAMAVVAGLAPAEVFLAIRYVLVTRWYASPYMEKYVCEALIQMGFVDDALARIKIRYRPMVDSPLTTLWEHWELVRTPGVYISYNHMWSGGPLTLLSQYVAGISPLEAGYTLFQVMPRMGPLRHIEATVASVRGAIELTLDRKEGVFNMDVRVPETTQALLAVPRAGESVQLNGRVAWRAGAASAELPPGVTFIGADAEYVRFRVPAGRWQAQSR